MATYKFIRYNKQGNSEYQRATGEIVTLGRLAVLGEPIPPTPSFEAWKMLVYSFKRCGWCFAVLESGKAEDAAAHLMEINHDNFDLPVPTKEGV